MAHSSPLAGRVVLVTGAARGIGAHTARLLAGRGARVSLTGLEPERLAALAAELGDDRHAWFECDVTDQKSVDAAVAATAERFGRIDVVMANAGVAAYGTVRTYDPDAFARTIDVNLTGVFRTVHAALPHIIERRGYVLAVASLASFTPVAGLAAYAASKSGVDSLACALRQEVAHLGVSVGSAHPSWIDTDMVRGARRDLSSFGEALRAMPPPANSTTSVEECATAIVRGIERRSRRIYVPRTVAGANWLRAVLSSPLADRVAARTTPSLIPRMEEEVARLGRSFGEHVRP